MPTKFIYQPHRLYDKQTIDEYYDIFGSNHSEENPKEELITRFKRYATVQKTSRDNIGTLNSFLSREPFFLEALMELYNSYWDEGNKLKMEETVEKAYISAVRLITDENDNWFESLEETMFVYDILIVALHRGAVKRWKEKNILEAKEMFQYLLKVSPEDDTGVRFYLLSLLKEETYETFELEKRAGGHKWFDEQVNNQEEFSSYNKEAWKHSPNHYLLFSPFES